MVWLPAVLSMAVHAACPPGDAHHILSMLLSLAPPMYAPSIRVELACAGGPGLGKLGICAFHRRLRVSGAQGACSVPPAAALHGHGLAGAHQGLVCAASQEIAALLCLPDVVFAEG